MVYDTRCVSGVLNESQFGAIQTAESIEMKAEQTLYLFQKLRGIE